mmetsp:Transcript_53314/g.73041  ORF Transcript_53314/g.73041 Transcript_53314/m.73041 type:complete len:196 (-) Transcript_53314:128-715(-)
MEAEVQGAHSMNTASLPTQHLRQARQSVVAPPSEQIAGRSTSPAHHEPGRSRNPPPEGPRFVAPKLAHDVSSSTPPFAKSPLRALRSGGPHAQGKSHGVGQRDLGLPRAQDSPLHNGYDAGLPQFPALPALNLEGPGAGRFGGNTASVATPESMRFTSFDFGGYMEPSGKGPLDTGKGLQGNMTSKILPMVMLDD